MIINKEHNFIFIHVFRTGGSSIDKAFGGNTKGVQTHDKLESIPNWKDYFSFGFIRNPWDRTVSSYMYLTRRNQFSGTFEEYVNLFDVGKMKTSKKYAQHDMVKNCSYIGRFEHLQEDFNEICNLVDHPEATLPWAWKTDHKPYIEMFSNDQKEIIAQALSGDIEHYGFSFDSTATKNIGIIK